MKMLQIKPEIFQFKSFKEFADEFKLGKDDLLFTHEFLYKPFMEEYNLGCKTIFQEKYGMSEPSDEMINKIFEDAKGYEFKRVVAIGGGSVVDIAKLLALKPVSSVNLWVEGKEPLEKEKELIIIPTTCGTGSEVTNLSIIGIVKANTKKGFGSPAMFADQTVLIPELVRGLPYKFFVYSSIDALIHATESFVSPKSNWYTELFAIKAIQLIMNGYIEIVKNGEEKRFDLLENFLIASNFAGIAFGNTGVGAVHALSYPLSGKYHVAHGEANYEFFTPVFKKYYEKNPNGKIKDLCQIYADVIGCKNDENVFAQIEQTLSSLIKMKPLSEYGMTQPECAEFAESVIINQQRLLVNNYTELTQNEIRGIFEQQFSL